MQDRRAQLTAVEPGRSCRKGELLGALLAGLLMASAGAVHAAQCGWLAASELDRVFPEHAPWRVTVGGEVGRCQFMSRTDRPPNMFAASQTVHDAEAAAGEHVRTLRRGMGESYEIVDAPSLGELGFFYMPAADSGEAAQRMVGYAAHRRKVSVMGTLTLQSPISAEQREAGAELVQAALTVAEDDRAMAAARDCPWLDAALLERVLPGGSVRQQVHGENSCLATDTAGAALVVSILEPSPALMQRRDGSCTWEEKPALGEGAALAHSCTAGRPRTVVRVLAGGRLVEYTVAQESEPTVAQREALAELGAWVVQARGN